MDDSTFRLRTNRRQFLAASGMLLVGQSGNATAQQREAASDSWLTFQYNRRNTGYDDTTAGLVTNVSESTQLQVGTPVRVPPIVANGHLFLSSTVLNGSGGRITAVDLESGHQTWESTDSAGVLSTPTAHEQRLLVARPDELVALSQTDGGEIWSAMVLPSGFSSPTVSDGTIYIGTRNGAVAAIEAATGRINWETTLASDAAVNTTPAVGATRVYAGAENNTVYALTKDGDIVWESTLASSVRVAPTLGDKSLFVADRNGTLSALEPTNGAEQWQVSREGSTVSSPAVANGTVFWAVESTLFALTATDGTEQWTFETSGFTGLNNIAPAPTRVGDVVYLTSGHNSAYGIDATTGAERWSFEPDSQGTVLALTVTGETAYVATEQGSVHVLTGDTNIDPTGTITYVPQNPAPGEEITLDAGSSSDPDGSITAYRWAFGSDADFEKTGQRVTWTADAEGTYEVRLQVTDDAGETMTTSIDLEVGGRQQTTTASRESTDFLTKYADQVPGGMVGLGAIGGTTGLTLLTALGLRLRGGDSSTEDTTNRKSKPQSNTDDQSVTNVFPDTGYEDYDQGDLLGEGKRTCVVQAAVSEYGEDVALCTLSTETSETIDTAVLDRFVEGIEAWSTIDDHDNILSVKDWGETPVPWAALELADGQFDPRAFADRAVETKRDLITQLCEAVHHGHRYGLVHGSLTPSNVLYVDDGSISLRVADWGVNAPALAGQDSDQANDIERIAAITYELVSGTRIPENSADVAESKAVGASLQTVFEKVWEGEGYETALHLRDAITSAL